MEELVRNGFWSGTGTFRTVPCLQQAEKGSKRCHCSVLHLSGNGVFKTLDNEVCRLTAGSSDRRQKIIELPFAASSFTAVPR